jgi:hypothetical protein
VLSSDQLAKGFGWAWRRRGLHLLIQRSAAAEGQPVFNVDLAIYGR